MIIEENGYGYSEKIRADNWTKEYADRMMKKHQSAEPIDHPDGSVTAPKIAFEAVTADKIARGAVGADKIEKKAIGAEEIDDAAIMTRHLANGQITADKLNNRCVTGEKIADAAVESKKISEGAVSKSKIADNAVTGSKIAAGAVNEYKIADNAVSASKLMDISVVTDKIADGAVTEDKLADGAVTEEKIANGSITEDKLSEVLIRTLSEDDRRYVCDALGICRITAPEQLEPYKSGDRMLLLNDTDSAVTGFQSYGDPRWDLYDDTELYSLMPGSIGLFYIIQRPVNGADPIAGKIGLVEENIGLDDIVNQMNDGFDEMYARFGTTDAKIGTLSSLKTSVKSNLVSAINEVKDTAESAVAGTIPNGSITTAKIANGAVTSAKLSDDVKQSIAEATGGAGMEYFKPELGNCPIDDIQTSVTFYTDYSNYLGTGKKLIFTNTSSTAINTIHFEYDYEEGTGYRYYDVVDNNNYNLTVITPGTSVSIRFETDPSQIEAGVDPWYCSRGVIEAVDINDYLIDGNMCYDTRENYTNKLIKSMDERITEISADVDKINAVNTIYVDSDGYLNIKEV